MYRQIKPFNQAKAGTKRYWCLRNVRLGYGIAARHATAWQAWLNTPQHTKDIPQGVDVPLFYSYTTTIDGVRDNYGHVNVRLANGRIWNDGRIWLNLAVFRAAHPRLHYRGWSTHLNGVEVIKHAPPAYNMPPVGSRIQLIPRQQRTTFKAGTTTRAGSINVNANDFVYLVRGYDKKFPNRIIINSKSAGGNGVALALAYTNGVRIDGWKQL